MSVVHITITIPVAFQYIKRILPITKFLNCIFKKALWNKKQENNKNKISIQMTQLTAFSM